MQELITRFLQSSHADPVYFVTGVVDLFSLILWGQLRKGLSNTQRALYRAIIVVAFLLTVACLSKYLGFIQEWKDLRTIFQP